MNHKKPDNSRNKRDGKSKPKEIPAKKKYVAKKSAPKATQKTVKKSENDGSIRLNKYISNSGVCTRREADIYIASGNVKVNGKVIIELGHKVLLTDQVHFDGRLITPEKKEYVLLNKPKGFDTSTKEDTLHKSAFSLVSNASKSRLFPVGSLQRNTLGLLLFTNDHDMIKKLTDTGLMVRKIFHVTLNKNLKFEDLKKIEEGIYIEHKKVIVDEISFIDNAPKNQLGIQLKSNRHNIVTKLFEHLEYEVVQLDRVSYAGLTKKDLPRGQWRHLSNQEIINLGMM